MSKHLCTFTGKYGDILWSLATAKHIATEMLHDKVDFAIMPYYESLLPLLRTQSYIDQAFVIKQWMRTHSNHGDQPWDPPHRSDGQGRISVAAFVGAEGDLDIFEDRVYEKYWHLTYKAHPGITAPEMPLIDFVAYQQGIRFNAINPVPFIEAVDCSDEFKVIELNKGNFMDVMHDGRLITYAFNEQYETQKNDFLQSLFSNAADEFEFFNVGRVGWKQAAYAINMSHQFVGCRSANWVIAVGLGKTTLTYEPHPARNQFGTLGRVFGCPYNPDFALPITLPPHQAGIAVATALKERRKKLQTVGA